MTLRFEASYVPRREVGGGRSSNQDRGSSAFRLVRALSTAPLTRAYGRVQSAEPLSDPVHLRPAMSMVRRGSRADARPRCRRRTEEKKCATLSTFPRTTPMSSAYCGSGAVVGLVRLFAGPSSRSLVRDEPGR